MRDRIMLNYVNRKFVIMILVLLITSCSSSEDNAYIRIAAIPTEDIEEQLLHLQPLAEYLSGVTDVKVEFVVTNDYTASIEALRSGHVQMAWLGPFSYVLAENMVDIVPLVGGIRKDTNDIFYNSIIFTHQKTGISSIDELRGHSFAFVDPASTSGYLVPLAMLLNNEINPEVDFSQVIYAGSHTAVELAVANGQVDAAADSLPSYELMVKSGYIEPDEIIILWTSDPIPPSPLVARKDLDPELIKKITKALITGGPEVISFEGEIAGYAAVTDEDYDVIRSVAKQVELLNDR